MLIVDTLVKVYLHLSQISCSVIIAIFIMLSLLFLKLLLARAQPQYRLLPLILCWTQGARTRGTEAESLCRREPHRPQSSVGVSRVAMSTPTQSDKNEPRRANRDSTNIVINGEPRTSTANLDPICRRGSVSMAVSAVCVSREP
ncbi:hypothetical protein RIF29_42243 [Crotalaria pallida]|uniref:Uncharacterized protein n=1 Tax=Crotalaria pallida TaxID=3830 RepID=A0AAN9E8S7_CROPI